MAKRPSAGPSREVYINSESAGSGGQGHWSKLADPFGGYEVPGPAFLSHDRAVAEQNARQQMFANPGFGFAVPQSTERTISSPVARYMLIPTTSTVGPRRRMSLPFGHKLAEWPAQEPPTDVEAQEQKKRPKTPPDCCAVCGVKKTAEWRRGPAGIRSLCNGCGLQAAKRARERALRGQAHPTTLENIETELMGIGAERFKSPDGKYTLPPNTRDRIITTIQRTEAQLGSSAKLKGKSRAERQAAGTLLGLARHSTRDQAVAPRSPPSRQSSSAERSRRSSSAEKLPSANLATKSPLSLGSLAHSLIYHEPPPTPTTATRSPSPFNYRRGGSFGSGSTTTKMSIAHIVNSSDPMSSPTQKTAQSSPRRGSTTSL